ncbi:MAG: alkaline phosphatase PhoX [Saprospiraceae bacterium]
MKYTRWATVLFFCLATFLLVAQNIGNFMSVVPTSQTGHLVLPCTHAFQVLAQTGDTLSDGSTLRYAPDFTAYVPINGRSDSGYLSLNHEIASLQGGVTVFDLRFDSQNKIWEIEEGLPIDFSAAGGINRPCSGCITPWGTVISGEESILTSDLDSNGYYDSGWLIESRPSDRQFVQKIWKAGNALHENCVIAADQRTVYWGADDQTHGYIFKYIATQKRQLADGKLFVLVRDDSISSTATWVQVPNHKPKFCNNINAFCQQIGAWNFSGVEDVEIGPSGKIYFAAKFSGRIWRFKDQGFSISDLEVFVESTQYPIQTAVGIKWTPWSNGADNLAFDNVNNLWVLQDGGENHIWVVRPSHTATNPKISLFATTPAGSEPTGITFTPDYRFMFLSLQHPSIVNRDTALDVTGKRIVFNRGTTLVIARKESFGMGEFPKTEPLSYNSVIELKLAPNPSKTGQVVLISRLFSIGKQVEIAVFDPTGAVCHTSQQYAEDNKIALDFQAKAKGVYIVRAVLEGKIGFATLIVE